MEKDRNFERAKRKYNEIMETIGYEHSTIGTEWSEGTENWNLRDMVAEADYYLSTYHESGHGNNDLKYEDRKRWISETGKLKRFIAHWEPYIKDMKGETRHCSKYDF